MKINITFTLPRGRRVLGIALCMAFLYLVLFNSGLVVPLSVRWARPLFLVLQQWPALTGGWFPAAMVSAVSCLLWAGALGLAFFPKGFVYRGEFAGHHADFSRVVEVVTLLHMVRIAGGVYGTSAKGELFYWVPLAVGLAVLVYRADTRLRFGASNLGAELVAALPFMAGAALLLAAMGTPLREWCTILYTLEVPLASFTTSLFAMIFYPLCLLLCLAPQWRRFVAPRLLPFVQ